MTDVDEITIFDEIVNCGIMEEDSVVNFGAGCGGGKFLDTLMEYNGSFGENLITAVDPDSKKIKILSKKFKGQNLSIEENSIQSFIEDTEIEYDWSVITGVFDNHIYGENQYDFVSMTVNTAYQKCKKGIVFTIKEILSEEFRYSMIYFFTEFSNSYQRFTVKKFNDGNYIFCIFK